MCICVYMYVYRCVCICVCYACTWQDTDGKDLALVVMIWQFSYSDEDNSPVLQVRSFSPLIADVYLFVCCIASIMAYKWMSEDFSGNTSHHVDLGIKLRRSGLAATTEPPPWPQL